jgi:hypothetical protein
MGQDSPLRVSGDDEKAQTPTDADVSTRKPNSDNETTHQDDSSTKEGSNTPPELVNGPLEPVNSVEYPDIWKTVVILIALFLVIFLVSLDMTIIGTAIPKITNTFNSVGDIGWYGSAYFFATTALQPSFGRAYKILNVRLLFFHFLVCFQF